MARHKTVPNFSSEIIDKENENFLNLTKYANEYSIIYSSPNGNCLSILLTGDEKLATCVRFYAALELVKHSKFYNEQIKKFAFFKACDCLEKEISLCLTPNKPIVGLVLSALSNITGYCIESIYPPVNGIKDPINSVLNRVFKPFASEISDIFKILWCGGSASNAPKWFPNHFTPVINNSNIVSNKLFEKSNNSFNSFDSFRSLEISRDSVHSEFEQEPNIVHKNCFALKGHF